MSPHIEPTTLHQQLGWWPPEIPAVDLSQGQTTKLGSHPENQIVGNPKDGLCNMSAFW